MLIWPFLCLSALIGSPVHLENTEPHTENKCICWMHCKSLWIKASAKCINVNVNVEDLKKNNPIIFLIFLKPLQLVKNEPFINNITACPLICKFPPTANAMSKVRAKHANCSVFGCTDEHKTLFRVPASKETREQRIYRFIYCKLCCCHTDLI